ncbi:MAG: ATP-grasp domain-containing protein [Firmicutes bacterium]|nr:ATP-grasp domain-containing protein [Bacillota bacterium]
MRIVLFNTSSRRFGDGSEVTYLPSRADDWDSTAALFPEHEIIYVAVNLGLFWLDIKNNKVAIKPKNVRYVIVEDKATVEEIAELIISLNPSVAIASSVTGSYIDWNPIMDSLVAEVLEKRGVKTIWQKTSTSFACFDKWQTHLALRELGLNVAKAVFVDKKLFWKEKTDPAISINIYREYVLHRIKELTLPIIIKSTVGTGSIDMKIAESFEQAIEILNDESSANYDVIVEEFLQGEAFGTEIHGAMGNYHVLPPFSLSINASGISDGHNNVKFGPVTNEKYKISKLQESLHRLAEAFGFVGSAQLDLVFYKDEWYIIEINARYSGMTLTTAIAEGRSTFTIYVESLLGSPVDYSKMENLKYVVNFKIPAQDDETLSDIYAFPNVQAINQYTIVNPGSEVPSKFCEVVFGRLDTKEELIEGLKALKKAFPEIISSTTVEEAEKLAKNG